MRAAADRVKAMFPVREKVEHLGKQDGKRGGRVPSKVTYKGVEYENAVVCARIHGWSVTKMRRLLWEEQGR
jgi:hypothetical protein